MALAFDTLGSTLTHRNVAVRATSAWFIGLTALVAAWLVSYRFMPEGAVSFSLASQLPLESLRQQAGLAAGIFLWNLAVGGTALMLSSFFRLGRVPLAYLAPWAWFALYGIALGTNSFAITTPGMRVAPQVEVAWNHVGLRELSAYLLAAAALADRHLWFQRSVWDWRLARVRSWTDLRLSRPEVVLLVAAVGLLAWSAATEAAQIVALLH
jgi:hypothetical protein